MQYKWTYLTPTATVTVTVTFTVTVIINRPNKLCPSADSVAAAALEEAVSGHHNKVFKNLVFLDQAIHTSG